LEALPWGSLEAVPWAPWKLQLAGILFFDEPWEAAWGSWKLEATTGWLEFLGSLNLGKLPGAPWKLSWALPWVPWKLPLASWKPKAAASSPVSQLVQLPSDTAWLHHASLVQKDIARLRMEVKRSQEKPRALPEGPWKPRDHSDYRKKKDFKLFHNRPWQLPEAPRSSCGLLRSPGAFRSSKHSQGTPYTCRKPKGPQAPPWDSW
jgi:hypothetical protein